ncbi:alpha/beta hydrolase [Rossellomorea oryzaecorticis]|uniref:Alpha/beta hydrolase n=1 Tax=Rossellomorea oryzaecorticis TaxID=1396505 RepID=A0ABW8VT27_9BACI|nr:alpha/beta hydrolase [[Bacillus] enclensis]MBH9966904.1 alpha/beta hydrolase [[Bacillus] enclensis]QWC23915.1 alpha/beta hydrolase [Bacillus haikouensis]
MIKRIGYTVCWLIVLTMIVLFGAASYFYNLAINRSDEAIKLYGTEEAVKAVSALEEEQERLQELTSWTESQDFEEVEIESDDGLTLSAVYLKNDAPIGKTVILAHGYKGNNEQLPEVTRYYYDKGYDILKPDARGHGKSEGDYIGMGWDDRNDMRKWIDYLIEEKNEKAIFLHGFSMGASTVLMTSGEDLPNQVKGIIADSGYTSVEEEMAHQLKHLYNLPSFPLIDITSKVTESKAGYSFDEASALDQVKKKKDDLPLFIIHGDKDELVPSEMAQRLYENAPGMKELWIIPGVGHTQGFLDEGEEYKRRLNGFIEEAMKQ